MNSVGVGAFFNLTNFGQMYSYHVLLLPMAVVLLVCAHVLLVRRTGSCRRSSSSARLPPRAPSAYRSGPHARTSRHEPPGTRRRHQALDGRATPPTTSSKSCASRSA